VNEEALTHWGLSRQKKEKRYLHRPIRYGAYYFSVCAHACVLVGARVYYILVRRKLEAEMDAKLLKACCKTEQEFAMPAGWQSVSNKERMHIGLPVSMKTRILIQD